MTLTRYPTASSGVVHQRERIGKGRLRTTMTGLLEKAKDLITRFKGSRYAFGIGILDKIGPMTAQLGKRVLLVSRARSEWLKPSLDRVISSLRNSGVEVLGPVQGAAPNAPREDVYRLQGHILHKRPEVVLSFESGSGIDACKAAAVLATFGDIEAELDPYFGVGEVTKLCERTGRKVLPIVASMTAASSSAHLTRYSNLTDPVAGQKKLIIDDAITPPQALFDYELTVTQPMPLTLDGGLDGMSHCLESYLGEKSERVTQIEEIALVGIELIMQGLKVLTKNPRDLAAREQVAMGTDLGGYAIMLGGTNGPHLNSFSLVNYISHGRACALMNPYYTAFFTPAVPDRVRKLGALYKKHGFIKEDIEGVSDQDLGRRVAEGMLNFNRSIQFPVALSEIENVGHEVINKILAAAKDPQLESKLMNMPIPLSSGSVDEYMGSILEAAWTGDLDRIVFMKR
jgi:alcohol dehydrogenase